MDSHAHVQFADYDKDRDDVISRALNAGVWMVNAGADLDSSERAVRVAEKYEQGVYATVGMHPSEQSAKTDDRQFWQKMGGLTKSEKCVGIGECGLEYFADTGDEEKESQAELFVAQINLAREAKKPLIIHCRDAYGDLYGILKENEKLLLPGRPALIHFFSGTTEDADRFLEMGFVFSFGGAATFPPKPGKTDFISLIKRIPTDSILLETDCPYVSPVPLRGERNEPAYVAYIAAKIADIKGTGTDDIAEVTTENALRFFAIEEPSR